MCLAVVRCVYDVEVATWGRRWRFTGGHVLWAAQEVSLALQLWIYIYTTGFLGWAHLKHE